MYLAHQVEPLWIQVIVEIDRIVVWCPRKTLTFASVWLRSLSCLCDTYLTVPLSVQCAARMSPICWRSLVKQSHCPRGSMFTGLFRMHIVVRRFYNCLNWFVLHLCSREPCILPVESLTLCELTGYETSFFNCSELITFVAHSGLQLNVTVRWESGCVILCSSPVNSNCFDKIPNLIAVILLAPCSKCNSVEKFALLLCFEDGKHFRRFITDKITAVHATYTFHMLVTNS